ncbi:VrrA/YqfQ family protein [Anoxybacillus sp. J5B_2022]|uniref:VrrA/YqfQ family protein n=1 Tax=Anoxybacillus sp. J5B_2022 TaxID=3003246 RepID=UPI002286B8D8|nr:VrrA/YqfQ family protein [Anoxybacillus sp. J5B_2022]MCZ0755579.1 VrrA/YqfQ family protein [Anoxybacillus sp. J5B_2022]
MMRPPMFPPPATRPFPFPRSSFPARSLPPYATPPTTGGGFLSRLFSRGPAMPSSPFAALTPMQNAASSTSATGGGISGMLTNVQKMLGIAQNVMPMVQQYGPLVKNLPAMMKIWKELKTTDNSEEKSEEKTDDKKEKQPAPRELPKATQPAKEKRRNEPKPSVPKLYI